MPILTIFIFIGSALVLFTILYSVAIKGWLHSIKKPLKNQGAKSISQGDRVSKSEEQLSIPKSKAAFKAFIFIFSTLLIIWAYIHYTSFDNLKFYARQNIEDLTDLKYTYYGSELYQSEIISDLDYDSKNYINIEHNKENHIVHEVLWDRCIRNKEKLIKIIFSRRVDVKEENYKIKALESERYIHGGEFYSITYLYLKWLISDIAPFKYWISPGIYRSDNSYDEDNNIIFDVSPTRASTEWRRIKYNSKRLFESSEIQSKLNEIEANLILKQTDFDIDSTTTIRIIINHKQIIPYSIYYLPVFRYEYPIGNLKITTYFKAKLEDYGRGCYYPDSNTIEWEKNCVDIDKIIINESKHNSLIWKPTNETIHNAYSYTLIFPENFSESPIFKYRQDWFSWK